MKTIADIIYHKNFPLEILDSKGNRIYYEDLVGFWEKWKRDYKGDRIYYENKTQYWTKREYDSNGNEIYYKNSVGDVVDKRP